MRIPHFDLKPAAEELAPELLARWTDLLARTAFVGGAEVEAFEKAFASYLGGEGCVGVANGTDALVRASSRNEECAREISGSRGR